MINTQTNKDMTTYKAVITEATSGQKGQIVANTKSSGQYKGMTKAQFTEATKYISAFTIEIVEV
jgi:hypothetical protein